MITPVHSFSKSPPPGPPYKAQIKLEYNAEGEKYGVPWRVTAGCMTVYAAGYVISRDTAKTLSPSQWNTLYSLLHGGPLYIDGELTLLMHNDKPYVRITPNPCTPTQRAARA